MSGPYSLYTTNTSTAYPRRLLYVTSGGRRLVPRAIYMTLAGMVPRAHVLVPFGGGAYIDYSFSADINGEYELLPYNNRYAGRYLVGMLCNPAITATAKQYTSGGSLVSTTNATQYAWVKLGHNTTGSYVDLSIVGFSQQTIEYIDIGLGADALAHVITPLPSLVHTIDLPVTYTTYNFEAVQAGGSVTLSL
jgi:hypothetical protein